MSRSDDQITARLYRLAAESAPSGGRLHAVGDQGLPFRRIAEIIGHHLDGLAWTSSPAEAEAQLPVRPGSPGQPTSSATTQELRG